jgi:GTP pyrophosphokinase
MAIVESYLSNEEVRSIKKAYNAAKMAHESQVRLSGEPYLTHLEEVAFILAEMRLDASTIIAGLLHDTLEDTNLTRHMIEGAFGQEVAAIVDGVTKFNKIPLSSEYAHKLKNFCKFLLALSSDIRVVFIKLADRLHNMRTIEHQLPDKIRKISLETLRVFAPLADMVGVNKIKDELELLSFVQVRPEEAEAVQLRLEELSSKNKKLIDSIVADFERLLKNTFFNFKVSGRLKTAYSIWEKMRKRNFNLLQLNDIVAIRIIVNSVEDCYYALGIVHSAYQAVQGTIKDYISSPKSNRYQSIHTVVLGPYKQQLEVQIRTKEMDKMAEYGVAAHWNYKRKTGNTDNFENYKWLRGFLNHIGERSFYPPSDQNKNNDLFCDEVFCFTPNGDVITLPREASVLDFAYNIHTLVGNTCIGAKINGDTVPIQKKLQNGDTVEIITSPFQRPVPSWISKVVLKKSREAINRSLKSQKCKEYSEIGQKIVKQSMMNFSQNCSEEEIKQQLMISLGCESLDDLYVKTGQCIITSQQISQVLCQQKSDKIKRSGQYSKPYSIVMVEAEGTSNIFYNLINVFFAHDAEVLDVKTEIIKDNKIAISFEIYRTDLPEMQELTKSLSDVEGVINIEEQI